MPEKQEEKHTFHSCMLDEDVVGSSGDAPPSHKDVVKIITILEDAGVTCCLIEEYALIYYGSGRKQNDRVLCVPDDLHKKATNLFTLHNNLLMVSQPSPMGGAGNLLRTFPRFKVVGQRDFWVIVTASYCNLSCKTANIVRSMGGLPYPRLSVYAQSLLDTQNGTDLEELIDGMDLSEEWGEKNLELNGDIDIEWARRRKAAVQAVGGNPAFLGLSTTPKKRRVLWQASVRRKQARMGLKKPAELYATRWRRHGSQDPTTIIRNLI